MQPEIHLPALCQKDLDILFQTSSKCVQSYEAVMHPQSAVVLKVQCILIPGVFRASLTAPNTFTKKGESLRK